MRLLRVSVSPEDLPASRRWRGFQYERLFDAVPERFGDRCLAGRSLPTYPVARIVTGQREWRFKQGRWAPKVLWQAEAALGARAETGKLPGGRYGRIHLGAGRQLRTLHHVLDRLSHRRRRLLAQDDDVIGVVGGLRSGANAARRIAPSTSGVLPR